jgi:hypothetical protein
MSPMQSKAQNAAMHAAAQGNSTLGIPKSVGTDFVNASQGEPVSALPQRAGPSSPLEASTGLPSGKKGTHRGRRSRGNGGSVNAHAEAKGHLANAQNASTPQASMAHLFKALSSLKKA